MTPRPNGARNIKMATTTTMYNQSNTCKKSRQSVNNVAGCHPITFDHNLYITAPVSFVVPFCLLGLQVSQPWSSSHVKQLRSCLLLLWRRGSPKVILWISPPPRWEPRKEASRLWGHRVLLHREALLQEPFLRRPNKLGRSGLNKVVDKDKHRCRHPSGTSLSSFLQLPLFSHHRIWGRDKPLSQEAAAHPQLLG